MSSPPSIAIAMQSPTLLEILARSSAWKLSVHLLGDHAGLAEAGIADLQNIDKDAPDARAVLVCSPAQLDQAKSRWPRAKVGWVIHNGRERRLLPLEHEPRVDFTVCFSERVRWYAQAGRNIPAFFISPYYEAEPRWSWADSGLWTLRNRPDTRADDRDNLLLAVSKGLPYAVYGQDQPLGLAGVGKKETLISSSSAYLSCLDRSAGFGLAEHECMASGVPVIGGWWGDMEDEMSSGYWGFQHSPSLMRSAAVRVCEDPDGARALSDLGLEYIRTRRTRQRMDDTIAYMISSLGI